MNISYNYTNTTFNVTHDKDDENMVFIFAIIGIIVCCVYNLCSESQDEQRRDLENKAIRAQNRITIKTLS